MTANDAGLDTQQLREECVTQVNAATLPTTQINAEVGCEF